VEWSPTQLRNNCSSYSSGKHTVAAVVGTTAAHGYYVLARLGPRRSLLLPMRPSTPPLTGISTRTTRSLIPAQAQQRLRFGTPRLEPVRGGFLFTAVVSREGMALPASYQWTVASGHTKP
jgi:hypothetical protein